MKKDMFPVVVYNENHSSYLLKLPYSVLNKLGWQPHDILTWCFDDKNTFLRKIDNKQVQNNMNKNVTIEEYFIDFHEGTAEFVLNLDEDTDLFTSVKVTLEEYPNYDNPICVINAVTEYFILDEEKELNPECISGQEIDVINNILNAEYSKYLNK